MCHYNENFHCHNLPCCQEYTYFMFFFPFLKVNLHQLWMNSLYWFYYILFLTHTNEKFGGWLNVVYSYLFLKTMMPETFLFQISCIGVKLILVLKTVIFMYLDCYYKIKDKFSRVSNRSAQKAPFIAYDVYEIIMKGLWDTDGILLKIHSWGWLFTKSNRSVQLIFLKKGNMHLLNGQLR